MFSKRPTSTLARNAERHNLVVVSDESYDRFEYDNRIHGTPAGRAAHADRTVVIRSFTKGFATPGWRIGYIFAPRFIIDACLKIFEWVALYGSLVPQAAAAAAMQGPANWLMTITAEFPNRRDRLVPRLREVDVTGFDRTEPRSGSPMFPGWAPPPRWPNGCSCGTASQPSTAHCWAFAGVGVGTSLPWFSEMSESFAGWVRNMVTTGAPISPYPGGY